MERPPKRFPDAGFLLALALFVAPAARLRGAESQPPADPLADWAVQEGYSLEIVASGFSFPTAIGIVGTPSQEPKAPKMFVTELRGKIKAVANDGSVTDFAKVETVKPLIDFPADTGEAGLAGICLAPDQGYLFVTYTYRDKYGVVRNGLTRFTAARRTFEGPATDRRDLSELFASDPSAYSHQIGACVVDGDGIYISVGDGGDPAASHNLEKTLGKLLRLTLDGEPHPANPFVASGGKSAAVYAYGLRNTFGLSVVDGRVFSAENGVVLDRFLEIRPGIDYGWDGTDESIATNGLAVFQETICPVHVAYAPADTGPLQPRPNPRFLIAASHADRTGVLSVEFDWKRNMAVGRPVYLLRRESGQNFYGVVGLALSPEGLFLTPILPVGPSGVLMRMRYDPDHAHARIIGRGSGAAQLIATYGCLKCHTLNGVGGTQGPALDKNSLLVRVSSRLIDPSYAALIEKLDAIPDPAIQANREARREVMSTPVENRPRIWIINRLLYPRFDEPSAQMPQMNMTREQAEAITTYLLKKPPRSNRWLRALTSRTFIGGTILGLLAGACLAVLVGRSARRRDRRSSGPAA